MTNNKWQSGLVLAIILAAVLFAGGLLVGAPTPVVGESLWPGEALLWRGQTPVTQTIQRHSLGVVGPEHVYLFYDTGLASATGTAAITVTRQWRGVVFETLSASSTVSTTQRATGVITVATASPYYPDMVVQVQTSVGTITPTIAVVGQ